VRRLLAHKAAVAVGALTVAVAGYSVPAALAGSNDNGGHTPGHKRHCPPTKTQTVTTTQTVTVTTTFTATSTVTVTVASPKAAAIAQARAQVVGEDCTS
jgi:carbohydrate-binding DOMON domain-containing protein